MLNLVSQHLLIMKQTGKSKIQSRTNSKIVPFCALPVRLLLFSPFLCPSESDALTLTSLLTDRLRTIIGYDRICVLDAGEIAVRFPG